MKANEVTPNGDPANTLSRRDLIRAVSLSAGAAMLFGASASTPAADLRAYSGGRLALEVDGATTFLRAAEGGNAFAEVVLEPPTEDLIQRKRPGAVRYEDLMLQTSMAAWQPLAGWINATLVKGPVPKSGALVYLDFNNNEVKRLEFFNAIITELTLPACDAAGKDPVNLTLRLSAESTRLTGGSGKPSSAAVATAAGAVKNLTAGFYKLNIQGLEPACARISKVAALTAKRALLPGPPVGELREKFVRQFAALDCSALSITLPEQDAGPFYAWFTDFAIKGNNGPKMERAARLEWLNPADGRTIVFADLSNLGIVRFAPVAATAGTDTIARVQVDMYCEGINVALTA